MMVDNLVTANTYLKTAVGSVFLPIHDGATENLFEAFLDSREPINLGSPRSLVILGIAAERATESEGADSIRLLIESVNDDEGRRCAAAHDRFKPHRP